MNVRVINMPTIKPIDEEIILTAARECGRIITVEEHSIIGGLGEAVCSVVSEKLPVPCAASASWISSVTPAPPMRSCVTTA